MQKVFADTNIVLDLMTARHPFFQYASILFEKAENKEIEIWVSPMCFVSTQYILRKQIGKDATLLALNGLRKIVNVCSSGANEVDLALISNFKDFEDALQYFTAINNHLQIIITRNPKDFPNASIPIMSAEEFLKNL